VLIAASRKEKVERPRRGSRSLGPQSHSHGCRVLRHPIFLRADQQQFPDNGKDQNIALVDLGANVMNVTVLRNEQTVYTREQAFGGSQLTQDIMRVYA